jgi:segregation and condensation protein A
MTAHVDAAPGDLAPVAAAGNAPFEVKLHNFEGPFDLLLSLIAKHKLDVTEIALSTVTDEFIAYIRALGKTWDLDQTTSFLVIAATLLDLKAARLLPQGDVEDEEDLALLEARDLLFARLMQYKAFKQVAGVLERRLAEEAKRFPRSVGLEDRFANLLPDVLIGLGLHEFSALAFRALQPKPTLEVSFAHLHAPTVSVREQAIVVVERLRRQGTMTFRALCGDALDTITRVARFLALLELFREGAVAFDQVSALSELSIRWTGSEDGEIEIHDEFDGGPDEPESSVDEPESSVVEPESSVVELVETTPGNPEEHEK